jgi:hypothetical protein
MVENYFPGPRVSRFVTPLDVVAEEFFDTLKRERWNASPWQVLAMWREFFHTIKSNPPRVSLKMTPFSPGRYNET